MATSDSSGVNQPSPWVGAKASTLASCLKSPSWWCSAWSTGEAWGLQQT